MPVQGLLQQLHHFAPSFASLKASHVMESLSLSSSFSASLSVAATAPSTVLSSSLASAAASASSLSLAAAIVDIPPSPSAVASAPSPLVEENSASSLLNSLREELVTARTEYTRQLAEARIETKTLESKYEEDVRVLRAQVDAAEQQGTAAQAQIRRLEANLWEGQIELQDTRERQETELTHLRTELQHTTEQAAQVTQLTDDLSKSRHAQTTAESQLVELRTQLAARQHAQETAEGQVTELQSQIARLRDAQHEAETKLTALQCELRTAEQARKTAEAERNEAMDSVHRLAHPLADKEQRARAAVQIAQEATAQQQRQQTSPSRSPRSFTAVSTLSPRVHISTSLAYDSDSDSETHTPQSSRSVTLQSRSFSTAESEQPSPRKSVRDKGAAKSVPATEPRPSRSSASSSSSLSSSLSPSHSSSSSLLVLSPSNAHTLVHRKERRQAQTDRVTRQLTAAQDVSSSYPCICFAVVCLVGSLSLLVARILLLLAYLSFSILSSVDSLSPQMRGVSDGLSLTACACFPDQEVAAMRRALATAQDAVQEQSKQHRRELQVPRSILLGRLLVLFSFSPLADIQMSPSACGTPDQYCGGTVEGMKSERKRGTEREERKEGREEGESKECLLD